MSKIRIMSEALSNRIAAGEVVERPASVVKELVENAIDAGAANVAVEIERAGIRRIAVRDDGSGMDADDALLCIEPHGTSKLLDESGIETISTLGFRGEAIPSIAAVSRFSLATRTAEAAEGTCVKVEGGRLLSAGPCGGRRGTCVEVRDLFFNTPARRKFLKSSATEEQHIEESMLLLAIGHPAVGFSLQIDGRIAFRCAPGGTLEYRLRELLGKSYAANLLPVSHRENGIVITGFTAAPGFSRIGRREQRTFLNARAVESPAIYRGIREGYATLENEAGRFPPAVLFLELDPREVDVNVHPAKREVRFKSEFAVTRAVAAAVSAALRGETGAESAADAPVEPPPEPLPDRLPLSGKLPLATLLGGAEIKYRPAGAVQPDFSAEFVHVAGEEETPLPPSALTDAAHGSSESASTPVPRETGAVKPAAFTGSWPETVLGIYDCTYILASGRDGLVLIDQHAAHERIMFERIVTAAENGGASSQRLLLPQTVELTRVQFNLLARNVKTFAQLGFELEPLGGSSVLVSALPQGLAVSGALETVLGDMLDELVENAALKLPVELAYAARAACKAAVKAHDELSLEAAAELLRQLKKCRQGTLCPHGRPTMVVLSTKELEKRFMRRN